MSKECDQTPVVESGLPETTCGIDVRKLYEENVDANLVRIGNGLSYGTGFLVSDNGNDCLIVTANHVVRSTPITPVSVSNVDSRMYLASVVARDKVHDLAALKITSDFSCKGIPLAASSDNTPEGAGVFASGYPVTTGVETVTPGIFRGKTEHPDPDDLQQEELATNLYLKTEHQIVPGNSGGPMVNGDGQVIGVISRSSKKDFAYSVPVDDIWQMLRSVEGWEKVQPQQ